MVKQLNLAEFSNIYCERQEQTAAGLLKVLQDQKEKYDPTGWCLLECVVLDSSRIGSLTIIPYGPNNTWKDIPDRPISPRGLCSDISEVIAILPSSEVV